MHPFEEYFLKKAATLSVRSANVLRFRDLYYFKPFVTYFCFDNKTENFRKYSGAGQKTEKELQGFIMEIKNHFKLCFHSAQQAAEELFMESLPVFIPAKIEKTWNELSELSKAALAKEEICDAGTFMTKLVFSNQLMPQLKTRIENIYTEIQHAVIKDATLQEPVQEDIMLQVTDQPDLLKMVNEYIEMTFNEPLQKSCIEFALNIYNPVHKPYDKIAEEFSISRETVRMTATFCRNKIWSIINVLRKETHSSGYQQYLFDEPIHLLKQPFTDSIRERLGITFTDKFLVEFLQNINAPLYRCYQPKPVLMKNNTVKAVFTKLSAVSRMDEFFQFLENKITDDTVSEYAFTFDQVYNKYVFTVPDHSAASFKTNFDDLLMQFKTMRINTINQKELYVIRKEKETPAYIYALNILRDTQKPLHFSDIYQHAVAYGCKNTSAENIHQSMIKHKNIFGLKGYGMYGLLEWGGYFGTIGDVAEKILNDNKKSMLFNDLKKEILKNLIVTPRSIAVCLFQTKTEKRFIKKDGWVELRKD
jgi:hypothetical protein